MDDARTAGSPRHSRTPLMTIAPAALIPAWWDPAFTILTIAGLACLAAAALLAAHARAADPWRRVARASHTRRRAASPARLARTPAPAPAPALEAIAAHLARRVPSRLPAVPTPGLSPVALQVVTGAEREAIARGVVETAAQLLARGETVVVVDAGRRLDLHAAFGGESHWGLAECLAGSLPLLGVVQSTGRAGLFLLARGEAPVESPWQAFGRLLDEATAQFGRVVVALEPDCPAFAAPAFGPREIEGWWAGDGGRPRGAQAFTERIGIPLLGLAVPGSLQTLLEGLPRSVPAAPGTTAPRGSAGVAAVLPAATAGPEAPGVAMSPTATTTPAAASPPAGTPTGLVEAGEPVAPVVLPCDPRAAERLRFLNWTRRLRLERAAAADRPGAASAPVPLALAPVS